MQNLCLFAHFDKDDTVADYVIRYVEKLKELQFSIVFISTANLGCLDIKRLRADCVDVILRENAGLDFGSWATGFAKYESEFTGRLLLANDSVYGPIGSLASALDQLTTTPADFYGFVESIELAPHLQSWFLLFEPWVVQSQEFKAVLSQPFAAMTKGEIIMNGELGLSECLVKAGFKYHAAYLTSRAGLAARYCPFNPTHLLWRELLVYDRIPFLKVELLRDNPMSLEDPETILSVVKQIDPSFYCQIKGHLLRSVKRSLHKPPLSSFGRRVRDMRSDLTRRGYRLSRDRRRAGEIWNLCKLFSIIIALKIWRALRVTDDLVRAGKV